MRAFIALELPEEIKIELGQIQKDLSIVGIQTRWIKPELMHLTLAFFESFAPEKISDIGQLIKSFAKKFGPIKLRLHCLDCFPNQTRAKIIFVELQGELDKLKTIAASFAEKSFAPHLTLGRLKKPQNLKEIINKVKIPKLEFTVNKICLIKSTLTSSGPIYENLKEVYSANSTAGNQASI